MSWRFWFIIKSETISKTIVSETIQNEAKKQKGGFISMLLGTLGASLLENILAGKGINRAGEGVIRSGYGNKRQDRKNKMDF